MILHCDEDVGTGIPKALNLVGYETRYLRKLGLAGKPDTIWLTKAGQNGWLVLSYNKKMLKVPNELLSIIVRDVWLTKGGSMK